MPRVTVNKDSLAVMPLPSLTPAPEILQPEPLKHELMSDVPLTNQQADTAPPVAPVQQLPPVQQIIREIKTVLIEVPLCENPPGLDGAPSFCKAHVNFNLVKSRSANGRHLLHRLWWALKENGAALANGTLTLQHVIIDGDICSLPNRDGGIQSQEGHRLKTLIQCGPRRNQRNPDC